MRLTKPQLERILALYDGFAVALRGYTIWINPPGLVVDPAPTLRARARQG